MTVMNKYARKLLYKYTCRIQIFNNDKYILGRIFQQVRVV